VNGEQEVDQEMVDKAEAVIAGLRSAYLDWVAEDMRKLNDLLAQVSAAPVERRSALMKAIFTIAHDVKGQGGSFGFDLMTQVGNQLCRTVECRDDWPDQALILVRRLLDGMGIILAQSLSGDGGDAGRALITDLRQAVRIDGGPLTLM
jgi:hypothetical protein